MNIIDFIKKPSSRIFVKAYIKRRDAITGLFEDTWVDISKYVSKWGKFKASLDAYAKNKFKFNNARLTLDNTNGIFNDNESDFSLWNGYAPATRSLLKIEAGYEAFTLNSNLIYERYSGPTNPTVFIGVIQQDPTVDATGYAYIDAFSLMNVLREYPARNLTGLTTTGQTASKAVESVRDLKDINNNYIFRPFFGDTVSNWVISTTTNTYDQLNTGTAQDLRSINTWDMIEKLAEAENKVTYIDREGTFYFKENAPNTNTSMFSFYGNIDNRQYGQTIQKLNYLKKDVPNYYSRVEVKFKDTDTYSSYVISELTLTVAGNNNSWLYGQKTYQISNYWIFNTATAITISNSVYNDVSTIKKEVELTTSFIPHLNILDPVQVYYSSSNVTQNDIWDMYSWCGDTNTSDDLYWTKNVDPLELNGSDFKIISIDLDLDNLTTTFKLRES